MAKTPTVAKKETPTVRRAGSHVVTADNPNPSMNWPAEPPETEAEAGAGEKNKTKDETAAGSTQAQAANPKTTRPGGN